MAPELTRHISQAHVTPILKPGGRPVASIILEYDSAAELTAQREAARLRTLAMVVEPLEEEPDEIAERAKFTVRFRIASCACGRRFRKMSGNHKTCPACSPRTVKREPIVCLCGTRFTPRSAVARFCSRTCQNAARKLTARLERMRENAA